MDGMDTRDESCDEAWNEELGEDLGSLVCLSQLLEALISIWVVRIFVRVEAAREVEVRALDLRTEAEMVNEEWRTRWRERQDYKMEERFHGEERGKDG